MTTAAPHRDGEPHPDDAVLAVDLGTGGPKVALVRLTGEVVDHEHRRVDLRMLPDGGAVEDPSQWWDAVLAAAGALAERGAVPPARIVAVACTGQWGSSVPVDAGGEPAGDCLLWLDQRGGELAGPHLGGRLAVDGLRPRVAVEFVRQAGGVPSTAGNDPTGHRLWLRHRAPDVWRRTAVVLEPVDYLNLRLTGEVAATQATMTLSWLTDNRRLDAVAYDPVLVRLAGADATRLPPLRPIRSIVGGVLGDVAERLGVRPGTPVVTGLPDLHSAALGSGAVGDHRGHLAVSTSSWVGAHTTARRTSVAHQMATVPGALPGRYVLANNHDAGGVSLEWLRDRVVAPDDGLGRGDPSLADLDAVAAAVPPGAGGVLFAPWLKGTRSPVADASVRAAFVGVGVDTGRAEMVRAVLEGVAHHVRWLWESSESVLRSPLGEPRAVGGGAGSDVWCQVLADVLGRPVHRARQPLLANVRGAALFAGVVLGRLGPAELDALTPVERTFRPDPGAAAVLDDAHAAFRTLHRSQRRLRRRSDR